MRLRSEISLGIGALLTLQVATTLVAVRMLSRISPAVEMVQRENVSSLESSEDILAALTSPTSPTEQGRPQMVQIAMEQVRLHGKLPEEPALVDRMERDLDEALGGNPEARGRVVTAIQDLGQVNRKAIDRAAQTARMLGTTGAWASVVLGLAGFWASIVVSRRLRARLETTLIDLDAVLEAVRRGERHRRVNRTDGPAESRRIADNLNWLLDRDEAGMTVAPSDATLHRALALHLLDHEVNAALVVGADGEIVATNRAALARLDPGGAGIPRTLRRVPPADPSRVIDGWRPERIGEHELWLWRHHPEDAG